MIHILNKLNELLQDQVRYLTEVSEYKQQDNFVIDNIDEELGLKVKNDDLKYIKSIKNNKKSVAYSLIFRDNNKTLKDEEVDVIA